MKTCITCLLWFLFPVFFFECLLTKAVSLFKIRLSENVYASQNILQPIKQFGFNSAHQFAVYRPLSYRLRNVTKTSMLGFTHASIKNKVFGSTKQPFLNRPGYILWFSMYICTHCLEVFSSSAFSCMYRIKINVHLWPFLMLVLRNWM